MNIALLFNPSSGTGRRAAAIDRISEVLRQDGHRVLPMRVGSPEMEEQAARQTLSASQALLIAGGDGTINHALPLAILTGVPIYHIPLGTENLFARHFGMSADPAGIRAALARNQVEQIDSGECNGRPFVVMCSAGPDADVVHRVAAARRGGISHRSYAIPIIQETFGGMVSPISLEVDGKVLFENRRGMAVIANGEHYAFGINPASGASMHDGELDVVFFPAPVNFLATGWIAASRLRLAHLLPGCVRSKGRHIVIVAPEPGFRLQMDGEMVTGPNEGSRHDQLEMRINPRSVRVLI